MRRALLGLFVAATVISMAAQAADNSAIAITMVDKGEAYLQKHGKEAPIREVNNKNPEFVQSKTYLTVLALDGTQLAHPINPKLV